MGISLVSHLFTEIVVTGAIALCISSVGVVAAVFDKSETSLHRYEWRASTFTASTQAEAAVAVAPDGDIVTVWSSRRQQGGRYGVYMQRFDVDGVAIGREQAVNLWTASHQQTPAVAVGPRGETWVAWRSHGQDGHTGAIIARRFDAEGRGGSEILVNQNGRGHQADPVVAVGPDGSAFVAWTSRPTAKASVCVMARVLARDGKFRTDEFAVGKPDQRESVPSPAVGRDGAVAIVYAVADQRGVPAGIRMQRFDLRGKRLGDEIDVCGQRRVSQVEPVITSAGDAYVVAWHDAESDGDDYGIVARRFDATGRPLGAAFVVNTTRRGPQNAAAIAGAADGSFVVGWNGSDGDESGVFARRFDADGRPGGDEFRLSKHRAGRQGMHAVAGTTRLRLAADGRVVCAWAGDGGFGDESSVNVTMMAREPLELAGREQGVTAEMQAALRAGPGAAGESADARPHEPPTFDPKQISKAEREIQVSRGGVAFTGIVSTGWTPPDPEMAVGPSHIVLITNGAIAFFQKDGALDFQDEIEGSFGFWGSVGATSLVFDPEVLYDESSGRFFAMAAEEDNSAGDRSFALLAVSADADPNGAWHKYRFDVTSLAGDGFDSPNLAVDEQAVYISGDDTTDSGPAYPMFIFDKASLLAGNPPVVSNALLIPTSTESAGIPPVSSGAAAFYMLEHEEGAGSTQVRIVALQDPLGTPTLQETAVTVAAYGPPEFPPQQGTTARPLTYDARFWSVAYFGGSLWGVHHVHGDRVRARWYEFRLRGWPDSGDPPILWQSGEIDPGPGVRTFFPSIAVDGNGTAAICYARSAPDEFISMETIFRYKQDPLSTLPPGISRKVSDGPYPNSRWGDYSAVQPDPASPRTFWAHHEYAEGGSWKTWVASFSTPFHKGDVNCDGSIDGEDIDPFFIALGDPIAYADLFPYCVLENADINEDNAVDAEDIDPFFVCLGAGACE